MKKLCIFDFDGTLFDSVDDVVICFNKTLELHDFPTLTKDEYLECLGGNIDEIISLILKDKSSPENIELIKGTYEKLYGDSLKNNTLPFSNIPELLEELQRNDITLAINSNRKTDSIKYFISKYLPDIDFIAVEGHNSTHPSKPDPAGVNNIIKKSGLKMEDAIYIGDSKTDIKTAKNAGIDCVVVTWGYGNKNDYENEYILKSVDEVFDLLDVIM